MATREFRDLLLKTDAQRALYVSQKMAFDGQMLLLTYNNAEWVFDGGEAAVLPGDDVHSVARRLQGVVAVRKLWDEIVGELRRLSRELRFEHWSCSLELCPRTLEECRAARLHIHAGLEARQRVQLSSVGVLRILGCTPPYQQWIRFGLLTDHLQLTRRSAGERLRGPALLLPGAQGWAAVQHWHASAA